MKDGKTREREPNFYLSFLFRWMGLMFPVPTLKPSLSFCNTNLYLKGDYKKEGIQVFTQVDSDGARGNGFKLKQGRFRLSVGEIFQSEWQGTGRPERLGMPPSLEVFKVRLDGALGNLIWCLMGSRQSLPMVGELELGDL